MAFAFASSDLKIACIAFVIAVFSPIALAAESDQPLSDTSSSSLFPDWIIYAVTFLVIVIGYFKLRASTESAFMDSHSSPSSSSSVVAEPVDPNRKFTLSELLKYNGEDPKRPLYLGCLGKVYDVTDAAGFYGPGGPYGVFAGRDASRGLAKMEVQYTSANIDDIGPAEKQTLMEWASKYDMKYTIVGVIEDFSEPNSGPKPPDGVFTNKKESEGKEKEKGQ